MSIKTKAKIIISGIFIVAFLLTMYKPFRNSVRDIVNGVIFANKFAMRMTGIPTAEDRIEMAKESKRLDPTTYFSNQKVIDFCLAVKNNDLTKAGQLLQEGLDVNTVGKNGMTPFYWWWYANRSQRNQCSFKKTFKYFLEKGANPLMPFKKEAGYLTSVLNDSINYGGVYFIRTIVIAKAINLKNMEEASLEAVKNNKENKQTVYNNKYYFSNIALTSLQNEERLDFKFILQNLIKQGVIIPKDSKTFPHYYFTDSLNEHWREIYIMLKEGLTYKFKDNEQDKDYTLIKKVKKDLENTNFFLYNIEQDGADYRLAVVKLLDKQGESLPQPKLPFNFKYLLKNGKDMLYINEGINTNTGEIIPGKENKWVKFTKIKTLEEALQDDEHKRAQQMKKAMEGCGL